MRGRLLIAAKLLLFIVPLHLVLSAYRWLPGGPTVLPALPVLELAAILALAAIAGLLRGRLRTVLILLTSVAASVLLLFAVGEALYAYIYQKSFVPWTDLAYLPALLGMVFETSLFESWSAMVLVYAIVIGIVGAPLYLGVRFCGVAFRRFPAVGASIVAVLTGLAVAGAFLDHTSMLVVRAADQITPPEPAVFDTSHNGGSNGYSESEIGELPDGPAARFPVLGGSDIHLIIVESYGHTLFSRPDHAAAIASTYERVERSLSAAGFTAYSSFLESPAFGGRSWLADATLLTGVTLDTQAKYDEAVEANLRNLTHMLGEAGFTRVLAAPGTYEADEKWRRFYSFDHYLFRYDFGYEGPFISFGAMPDQYLLHTVDRFVRDIEKPVFAAYVLVSSHVPFERVPPYVEDWGELSDGSLFHTEPSAEFDNNWLTGGEYPEGYIASMDYVLTTIGAYLTERVDDDSLFVVVGDHQPRIPISERGATFSVPVHVLAKDSRKVRPFRHYGFEEGFTPSSSEHHPPMASFLSMLLSVLEGNAEARVRLERNVPQ